MSAHPTLDSFLARWQPAGGAERANYQSFLNELCDLLQVPRPDPTTPDDSKNLYVFDRSITTTHSDGTTSPNFIDLYKRAHFVLETKQGIERNAGILPATSAADAPVAPPGTPISRLAAPPRLKRGHGIRGTPLWNDALLRAKSQAENYVRNIPDDNPPFLLVIDVGYSFETYSDFSGLGKTYTPFPDNLSHRFKLTDLADPKRGPELLDRLKKIWTDPHSLNPAKRSAKVTRKISAALAELSKSLEAAGHHPESVAHFLMRLLFTLFAEDVHLIKDDAFTKMLKSIADKPEMFAPSAQLVWLDMDKGAPSPLLRQKLLQFNGGLFKETHALKLDGNQLAILIQAAEQDWSDVEPAIFGTLLERALDPAERHKLGAHFTPRAYVERLVLPTVIEPLREEWSVAKSAAINFAQKGRMDDALHAVGEFLKYLCSVTVLDPACGTANFLYVTLEHMKRLEGEINDFVSQFLQTQLPLQYISLTVDPHQFRGIEINPRAAAIADLVLWIGYLQWHFRTHGNAMPKEPVLKKFDNIECRDAVLAYDSKELARDEQGKPLSRWDNITTKTHPISGEEIPDESARVPIYTFINPHKTVWPTTDFIVGNPPFVANRNMRAELGDGYVEALSAAYPEVTQAIDLVMYFWMKGADLVATNKTRRSGLITTSRFRMQQNQSVVKERVPLKAQFAFAIPDHPWLGEDTTASVRVAMTVVSTQPQTPAKPRLMLAPDHDTMRRNDSDGDDLDALKLIEVNIESIPPDLSPSVNISNLRDLKAWAGLCHAGMKPYAKTLIVDEHKARPLFKSVSDFERHAPLYLNGKDIAQTRRNSRVLDFFGVTLEELRAQFPEAYQYLYDHTRQERKEERNPRLRKEWWLFEANRLELREAIKSLRRYIATVENSPMRYFVFVEATALPDQKLRVTASDDAFVLGVLSSSIHTIFATRLGGRHGVGNTPVYNTRCVVTFPFPDCTAKQKTRIRKIAEELDAHRKRHQAKFPDLTLTDMYNVLEKLRAIDKGTLSNADFAPADKQIHNRGLISILKQLHDDLDSAVFDAYNWPPTLTDEQLLENLVTLNHQRAAEEAAGTIKYLRPEFQNPVTKQA